MISVLRIQGEMVSIYIGVCVDLPAVMGWMGYTALVIPNGSEWPQSAENEVHLYNSCCVI